MHRPSVPAVMLAASLASSFSSVIAQAWGTDPTINTPICTAANSQFASVAVSDGALGAIIAWNDYRAGGSSSSNVFAQRVNATGAPLWAANGVLICNAAGAHDNVRMIADGSGGAILAWTDTRSGTSAIYTQHINAAGALLWGSGGMLISTLSLAQDFPNLISDGAGGALIGFRYNQYQVFVQRVDSSGNILWGSFGRGVSASGGFTGEPVLATDGAGGVFIAWADIRTGNYNIYVQHVNSGSLTTFVSNGIDLTPVPYDRLNPSIAPDGSGGVFVVFLESPGFKFHVLRLLAGGTIVGPANGLQLEGTDPYRRENTAAVVSDNTNGVIIAWADFPTIGDNQGNIYAQRVNASVVPQWTTQPVVISANPADQFNVRLLADGTGGAIVTWADSRSGVALDVYAQHLNSAGVSQWRADGIPVSSAGGDQYQAALAGDGFGGAIVSWSDSRSGNFDLYAQNIEHFGLLGNPAPAIVSARDIGNDQGGAVHLVWNASPYDVGPDYTVASYDVWRRLTTSSAQTALAKGAIRLDASQGAPDNATLAPGAAHRIIRVLPDGAQSQYWEFLATVPARANAAYSYPAPTLQDSMPAGNPFTVFMVGAAARSGSGFWNSAPDSGYSVDNIPPLAPAPFAATYQNGATRLHWGRNSEIDFAFYRLYRGSSAGFVPGPSNLVVAEPDTGYADPGAAGSWYKLAAVDDHGNASAFAVLGPNNTTGVDGGEGVHEFGLVLASANPSLGPTALRYSLAHRGQARLSIFDLAGREVRVLLNGMIEAGEHTARWDGLDESGRSTSQGLYYIRLEAGDRSAMLRVVRLR